ncbi:hypothetical protein NJ7G_3140 [Natrinema sp. J7-2]|nr:hypothetical protein NJ7G_3140 [Natrinema sp. J7-2]
MSIPRRRTRGRASMRVADGVNAVTSVAAIVALTLIMLAAP